MMLPKRDARAEAQQDSQGRWVLHPGHQRARQFRHMLLFFLLWTGITVLSLAVLLSGSPTQPATEVGPLWTWELGLILVLFLGAGVWLVFKLVKHFKAFSAPKTELYLQSLSWRMGQRETISWQLPKDAKLSQFEIRLLCLEEKTCKRNPASDTDLTPEVTTAAIAELPMHLATGLIADHGVVEFEIPSELTPSQQSENHRIGWVLEVMTQGPGLEARDRYLLELTADA